MNRHRFLSLFAVALLLAGSLLIPTAPGVQADPPEPVPVDPLILEHMESSPDGTAGFFILFREQADLSPAYEIDDWDLRGQFVYETLKATAERSQARVTAWLDARGIPYRLFLINNALFITADYETLETLQRFPEVAGFRGNHTYSYHDPILTVGPEPPSPTALAWGIDLVGADNVWNDFGVKGQGIIVASIDSGVDYDHDALWINYKCQSDPSSNECWEDPDETCGPPGSDPCDPLGHGTHTMGTMIGDDDPGLTWNAGMAPDAQWISCNAGSPSEYALGVCGDWVLAPNGDPANRPHVVNNSWGGGGCDTWYQARVQAWRAAGIFPAFSAGNSGSGCNTVGSPGDYPESFASGATDSNDNIASFSSRGPSCWNETKPEVSAPGVNVCSSVPGNGWSCSYSGTSMASPHTAGLVALLWSADPGLIGDIGATETLIMDTAVCYEDLSCGGDPCPGCNNVYGCGRIDAYAAVSLLADSGHLDGYVDDATSGAPIENAQVDAERDAGGTFTEYTDPTGYYTMTAPSGTYTVTASAYGYLPETVYGVVVVTDTLTTQDFSLTPASTYVVSGTVSDAVTGAPLYAQIEVLDAPISPTWTNPATGFYSVTVASGTYTFRVMADLHLPEEREVIADQDQTQDFALDPLPCILLVDDDGNDPDVRSYYTDPLDDLGLEYNVWDLDTEGDPEASDLIGYQMVIWFTGYPWGNTFNDANENAVSAYLDAGGNFFLSSQDYLYDFGLTPFGQNYLHIGSYDSDVGQTTVTGDTIYDGLGPYGLSYPFTNYSDVVDPDAEGMIAFTGNYGNAGVAYDGGSFHTVFFGYPFEAIPNLPDRSDVLSVTVSFFGGCGCDPIGGADFSWTPSTPLVGEDVVFSGTVAGGTLPVTYTWDLGDGTMDAGQTVTHAYTAEGIYTVIMTATNECSTQTVDYPLTVLAPEPPTASFVHNGPICLDQTGVFTNTSDPGAPPADEYIWDFGDGVSMTVPTTATVTHDYADHGTYTVTLEACNTQGCDTAADTIQVLPLPLAAFSYTMEGLTVAFTNTSMYASAYLWSFGDGMTSTMEHPVYTYTVGGTYTVTLEATGDCGTDTYVEMVTVGFPPVAGFTSNSPVHLEEVMHFTNTTTGTLPITFFWDLGDGITSTLEHPTHTYTAVGLYTVTLTATNQLGCDVFSGVVEVLPVGYNVYLPITMRE